MLSTYASQLLSKAADSDPLFFSFTTQDSNGRDNRNLYNDDSEDDEEIELGGESSQLHPRATTHDSPFIDPESQVNNLQESLINDPHSRPYTLPRIRELSVPLSALKFVDPFWATLFILCMVASLIGSFISLFTHSSSHWTSRAFLASFMPLITLLPVVAALWSYASLAVLAVLEKQVVIVSAVLSTATYFACALMAFIGSFEVTSGAWILRIMSIPLLASSIYRGLRLPPLLTSSPTSNAPLTLSLNLLRHPSHTRLILLSPLLILGSIVLSLPTLLLLTKTEQWYTTLLVATILIWTWGIMRGISRSISATMLGNWYYAPLPTHPPKTLFALSLHRALRTSLGSIALSAAISLFSNTLALASSVLNFLSWIVPGSLLWARPAVMTMNWCVRYLDQTVERWTRGAVIVVGMRGSPFLTSLRAAPSRSPLHLAGGGGAIVFFPTFLVAYLALSSSTDGAVIYPSLMVALLSTLSSRTATGLVGDVCDTLGVCFALDKDREQEDDEDDEEDVGAEGGSRRERRQLVRESFTSAPLATHGQTPVTPSTAAKTATGTPFLPEFLSSDSDSDEQDIDPYHNNLSASSQSSPDSTTLDDANARERARLNEMARRQQIQESSLMQESEQGSRTFPSDFF